MPPNKIGPHIDGPLTAPALKWSRVAPVVKQLDGTDGLRAAPPGAITVYRKYFPNQDLSRNGGDVANEIINSLGGFRPTYTELYVGAGMALGQGLEGLVRLTAEAVPILHAAGIGVAGFSFYEGNGNLQEWLYIQAHGFAGVDVLSPQEYWFGPPPFDGYHALRYRMVHEWLGGNHPPFLIGEAGRHSVPTDPQCAHGDDCGWVVTGISAEQYVYELMAYDAELSKDPYVLGAAIFTAAPNYDWTTFDTDRITDQILGAEPPPIIIPRPSMAAVALLAGLVVGGAFVALAAADLAGVKGEITVGGVTRQFLGSEEVPVLELNPGDPIPPGYTRIEPV